MIRRHFIEPLLLCCVLLTGALAASCSNAFLDYGDGPDKVFGNLNGVMLYEGSAIPSTMAAEALREAHPRKTEADTLIISLFSNVGLVEGYTEMERLHMESIYSSITQYGYLAMKSHGEYHFNPGLTMAGIASGASVTADIAVAGREPGTNLGDLFTLYALSLDNAFRYRYPGFTVYRDYISDGTPETFNSYFGAGMTFPGLEKGSCVCFAIPVYQELRNGGFSLTFSIPAEYSDGIDFGSNGLPREGAATKTISVSASVHVRNPSNLDALPLTSNMIYFD